MILDKFSRNFWLAKFFYGSNKFVHVDNRKAGAVWGWRKSLTLRVFIHWKLLLRLVFVHLSWIIYRIWNISWYFFSAFTPFLYRTGFHIFVCLFLTFIFAFKARIIDRINDCMKMNNISTRNSSLKTDSFIRFLEPVGNFSSYFFFFLFFIYREEFSFRRKLH